MKSSVVGSPLRVISWSLLHVASRDLALRATKLALGIIIAVALSDVSMSQTTENKTSSEGKKSHGDVAEIAGWSKAKFGMSIATVQDTFPGAREENLYCQEALLPNVIPGRICKTLVLTDHQVAGSTFVVKFSFDTSETLDGITLSLQDKAAFSQSYAQSIAKELQALYGKGEFAAPSEEQSRQRAKERCTQLLNKDKQGAGTKPSDWFVEVGSETYLLIKQSRGEISLRSHWTQLCENIPAWIEDHYKKGLQNLRRGFPTLYMSYTRRVAVPAKSGL